MSKNLKIILVIAAVIVVSVAVYLYILSNNRPMPGSDEDEHGCIGSAGYSWCQAKQKCLRSWEEECK